MTKQKVYALCDIDSFYWSSEVLFDPALKGRPGIVASNGDSCAVARSPQAKAIGIKMGDPIFKIQPLIRRHGVVIRSSNYSLYNELSVRFMDTLATLAPEVLPYSIDEAFLDITGIENVSDYLAFGREVQDRVHQWTGLPICVGISTSLTLAKLANRAAKKYRATGGVVDLTDPARQRRLLAITPVGDIWGIGSRISRKLDAMGISTGLQLADADPALIRSRFSVVVERTLRDLRGEACHSIDSTPATAQQIIRAKAFGSPIESLTDMLAAVTSYTVRAAEKVRQENRLVGHLNVFLTTNPFQDIGRYSNTASVSLVRPTDDTRVLITTAGRLIRSIWRDGYRYTKAGVMLSDFRVPGSEQQDLFEDDTDVARSQSLMATLDRINQSGFGKVRFARQTINSERWATKRQILSPAYTTRWSDLPIAR